MRVTLDSVGFDVDGQPLVSDVTFTFQPGSLTALVGPNGAGKTTLIRLLSGDVLPSKGSVLYEDEPLVGISVARLARLRAVLPHSPRSDTPFTVDQVVSMGRYVFRGDVDESVDPEKELVDKAIAALDLGRIRSRPIRFLSGGEQQRAAIARVVAQRSPLLLFDEPTTALDLGHQEAVMALMVDLASQGHTVVAVLHDLNLTAHFDQAMLLHLGGVVSSGTPSDVLTSDVLSTVYGHPIDVVPHPLRPGVLVLPRSLGPSTSVGRMRGRNPR
jgi:iron complex transport system ATP-binding protein